MNRIFDLFDIRPFDGMGLRILILVPVFSFLLSTAFALGMPEEVYFVHYLIVLWLLVVGVRKDQYLLQQNCAYAPNSYWILIAPVYLWLRERRNKNNLNIFFAYCAVFIVSMTASVYFERWQAYDQYVQSLCPTVDEIVHRVNPDQTCSRIYNVERAAGDRYLARVQFESGARIGITVDMNSDGSSYVTLAE